LLKDFVNIIVFRLIQEGVKGFSKGGGFANRYVFSHKEIEVFSKDIDLIKKK
jgi:hypothetical protein